MEKDVLEGVLLQFESKAQLDDLQSLQLVLTTSTESPALQALASQDLLLEGQTQSFKKFILFPMLML